MNEFQHFYIFFVTYFWRVGSDYNGRVVNVFKSQNKVLIVNTVLLAIGLNNFNFKRWKQTSEEIEDECHTKHLV